MSRILIKRGGGIGDLIMLTPALDELKRCGHEIFIDTKHPEIFHLNPSVTRCNAGFPDHKYEVIHDLEGAVEPWEIVKGDKAIPMDDYKTLPRIDLWCRQLGLQTPKHPVVKYFLSPEEITTAKTLLSKCTRPIILIVLTCTSAYRTYPLQPLLTALKELSHSYDVVLVGDHGGWHHQWTLPMRDFIASSSIIDLSHSHLFTLRMLGGLLGVADLVISNDTGPLHMAAALNKPTIGLFGPIDPSTRTSYYPTVVPLTAKPLCLCHDMPTKNDCPDVDIRKGNRIGASCMWAIPPSRIIETARHILSMLSRKDYVRSQAIQYCQGVGQTYGEYLIHEEETQEKTCPSWIYTGWTCGTGGDDKLFHLIHMSLSKLKPGGKLIIHEPIGCLTKSTNNPIISQCFNGTKNYLRDQPLTILKEIPLCHKNGFLIIGEKCI